jgi:hypothetical protein
VIEGWSHPRPLPRACAADHEIARILQSAPLARAVDELLDPVSSDDGRRSAFESADRETLLEITILSHSVSCWPAFMTFYQPELEKASGGLNALAHAAEALYAPDVSPVVRLLAEEGARPMVAALLAEEGARAMVAALLAMRSAPDGLAARTEALYAAWLCGSVVGATQDVVAP